MPKVTIYTTAYCPYCHSAKALLRRKNVEFSEIDVSYDAEERQRMMAKAQGKRTVPRCRVFVVHDDVAAQITAYETFGAGALDALSQERLPVGADLFDQHHGVHCRAPR